MFKIKNNGETDFYNETMDKLGPSQTNTKYSVWQAISRNIGQRDTPRVMAGGRAILGNFVEEVEGGDINFAMLKDGMPFFSGDPVIQVIGDKSLARKLEPKILSVLYSMTEIATRSKEWVDNFGEDRIIDVGMRGTFPGGWNYATEAILIGGIKLTASTGVRNIPWLKEGRDYTLVGTTGHSLYLEYLAAGYNQREAFSKILDKFEKNFPNKPCSLLVDTVNSRIGLEDAISVITSQKKKTGQTHWLRLDSSEKGFGLKEQAIYALENILTEVPDCKVIIEDGVTLAKAKEYDSFIRRAGFNPDEHILYGIGGALVNDITRDKNGSWAYKPSLFRTTNTGDVGVLKLSSNPIKNSLAGLIGLSYDINNPRLVDYKTEDIANEIMSQSQISKYMNSSLENLQNTAKPYWDKVVDAPNRWFTSYDLDKSLASQREIALKKIKNFGGK